MSAELDAEARAASSQVEAFFERYYGISECLAATQIVRDTTTEVTEGGIAAHRLYGSLLETLKLIQQNNAEDIDFVWVANLTTGEVLQNDGTIFGPAELDYTTRSWYKLVTEKQDTIITEAYTSVNTNATMVTVASPVYSNGKLVGIVGIDLNMEHITQRLAAISVGTDGYITLYDSSNRIVYHPDSSVVNTNAADANYSSNMLNAIVNKEDLSATLYTRGGTEYYGSTSSIESLGYTVLGVMPVTEYTTHTSAILRVLIIGMVGCAILLTAVCVFIALSITRPLKRLNTAVGKLADGELNVTVDTHGRDEVAEVGDNVARIVERLKEYILYIDEVSVVLNQIGAGNLVFTLQQEYVGEFSKIKEALLNIRSTLTETLTNIAQSADQVNAGSEQIASGAQALAQGATEQASSVQELSSAVQELSRQATEEAEKAIEAGRFLEQVKDEVEKSNSQMETMRKAMEDISVQSTAIRGIIKTIDDIAFQTNILALNAAVEAARAGSAGKGFAVVADEVRSLAGKSAEAAQKTNELIENSVRAVEHGEELTKLTADSLVVVSDRTKQVVATMEAVAEAYHEQADRLSEISKGVDQISDVVQTNSATAEESAAASQQLSGQASMMHQQIAQFKLGQDIGEPAWQPEAAPASFDEWDMEGKY
ncbi:methyl-accepting chemotaxis protein [Pseudoflavonifractor phocaeensis]|uniref:methyl-accepting chemotaxis protein n=1 Tax=Pseudoflavonifractor phocaeensis TaxID=1870988 RepID=UPI0019590E1B|nr:methyl-accepting chemotaxis protein [Pseudoflavonifractor phocaeensis]